MSQAAHTSDEIARRGKAIYEHDIRQKVEDDHHGEVVVIEIRSGAYEIDRNHLTAVRRARAAHPCGTFFAMRIGFPALAHIRGRRTASLFI